jgi:phenylacetate-CoA ligase
MNFKDLAKNLPYPLKQGLKYVYGAIPPPIRYGKVFRETYAFLQESQWWSREQLEEYQLVQLSKLLQHVYENVPYYRRIFDERGLKPKDIQDFNDLQQLPYLTKEIVQNNLPDLVAQNFSQSKLQYATTGGSTGIPLGFYREKGVSSAKEWAFMLSQWNRIGFKNDDRCVVLRGAVVQSVSKYKFWEYDPLNKSLILSSYHMTDENLPKYIEKIREFKPKFIRAYPSTITILARFVEENNIASFSSIKAILCSSENLYSWQRELLETVFQCRVYSWYGHAEQAVLAGECEHSTYYHIFSEYGIVELIGKDGKPMKQEDELGEVVATGLFNFACPLIRYRTMDLATLANTKCKCGRNYPLLKKVEGRLQELIITGTGRLISMTAMNMHSDVFDNVKQFQFYQEKKGEVIFNIVKKDTYTERDTKYIRSELYKKLGDDVNVIIRFVDDIPRTQSGLHWNIPMNHPTTHIVDIMSISLM